MNLRPLVFAGLLSLAGACASTSKAAEDELIFYPEPPDPPRVQFLRTISVGQDVEEGSSSLDKILFGDQQADKSILAPYGLAMRDGIVYVCDVQQGVVLTIDIAGKKLDFLDPKGRGKLQKPNNLAFGPAGRLYVADLGRRQVVVLDASFGYEAEFGPFGDESRVVDVEVAGDELYVADAGSSCVRVLDRSTGEELRSFGPSEDPAQRLRAPTNLALDPEGNVYVVDTVDCRVFVYGPDGSFLRTIGSAGDTVGQFARPKGIDIHDGLIFVVDAAFENCQVFNEDGEPLLFFGGSGVGPGGMYLPTGVWVGETDFGPFRDLLAPDFEPEAMIVVANQYGPRKVNFFALGKSSKFDYDAKEKARP